MTLQARDANFPRGVSLSGIFYRHVSSDNRDSWWDVTLTTHWQHAAYGTEAKVLSFEHIIWLSSLQLSSRQFDRRLSEENEFFVSI